MRALIVPALLAVFGLSGCVTAAKMDLPAFPVAVEKVPVKGLGMGQSGTFRAGDVAGSFTRQESRLGLFDPLFVSHRGGSSFSAWMPEFGGQVQAECGMIRNTVNAGVISVDVSKMTYRCAFFLDGVPMDADFILRDSVETTAGMMAVEERRGRVEVGRTRLTVLSSNRIAGASLPTETPIGYVMEWAGAPIGAVELNGTTPQLFLPVGIDPEARQAVLLAGLALSVFWDPANSLL